MIAAPDTKSKKLIYFLILLVIIAWIGITGFLGYKYYLSNLKGKDEQKILKNQVSRHIDFSGSEPTFATITDAAALKTQDQFYKKAQNGDKIVIWEEKALIYRPSTDKIIDIGIVIQHPQAKLETNTQQNKARVLVLNGTQVPELAGKVAKTIKENNVTSKLVSEVSTGDAKQKDYEDTIIVDLSNNKYSELTKNLTTITKGKVDKMPSNENDTTDADIVVILSKESE